MKLLLVHHNQDARLVSQLQRLAAIGADQGATVTLHNLGNRPSFQALQWSWRHRGRRLLGHYRRLRRTCVQHDAVIFVNSLMHHDAVACLPGIKAYLCQDSLDQAAGWADHLDVFDAVLHTNPAHRFQLLHWGAKPLCWVPTLISGVPAKRIPATAGGRRRGAVVLHDGATACQKRLAAIRKGLPLAACFDVTDFTPAYRDAMGHAVSGVSVAICLNGGSGPNGESLFTAAAWGAMPLSEDATGLAQFFTPGQEAIGFNTTPEGIAQAMRYTTDPQAAAKIAQAAGARYLENYAPASAFASLTRVIQKQIDAGQHTSTPNELPRPTLASDIARGLRVARRRVGDVVRAASRAAVTPRCPAIEDAWHQPTDERAYLGQEVPVYIENPEMMHINKAQERLDNGEPLDWPNILALNWAVTSLAGDAKNIVEVGSGTGPFADFASLDPRRCIHCLEDDEFARTQAIKVRSRPNVRYTTGKNAQLNDTYDLLVSVEVIEHVDDLNSYLGFCSSLSQRAIFTTPNRQFVRASSHIGPPPYGPHVREFAAGELYWVLRQHYHTVRLYHMPNVFVPWLAPMTIEGRGTPIIAECIGRIAKTGQQPQVTPAAEPERVRNAA